MSSGQALGPELVDDARDLRWAQAVSIAQGSPDPAARDAQRRRRGLVLLPLVGLLLLCAAGGVIAGVLADGGTVRRPPSRDQETWQIVLQALGLVLLVAGFVVTTRQGGWGARWRAPISALDRLQKRDALQQIRGRKEPDPAHPERLLVLRHSAARMAHPWGFLLLMGAVTMNLVAQTVQPPSPLFPRALSILAGVCLVVGVGA